MSGYVRPDEAAGALSEIRKRQEQVIDAVLVPLWYWWAVAVSMVGIGAIADTHRKVVIAVGVSVIATGLAALTGAMIFGAWRQTRIRSADLLGSRGALMIVVFVWLIVGVTLGIGFGLRGAGVPEPATIATAIGAVGLVAAGPALMRALRRTMMSNRAGNAR